MRVAIFAPNPPNTYSGGRYHSLMMAEALAAGGGEVHYVTNHRPIFYDDLAVYPDHAAIRLRLTRDFASALPDGKFDLVVLVPGTRWTEFYLRTVAFAMDRDAHLVLLNFEDADWFNSLSPVPRDPADWRLWKWSARFATLILSISAEGSRHAERFYRRVPRSARFDYCHPTINTIAADAAGQRRPERRVVMMARFGQSHHKGSREIVDLIGESMRGFTLVLLLGAGEIPADTLDELEARCARFDARLEIERRLSDREKFAEIKRASLMLFPSLFEGFGYPPIEAQYCGVPCVAFDLPVLRETCGDGLIYARLGDWEDFRRKMDEALRSPHDFTYLRAHVAMQAGLEAHRDRLRRILPPLLDLRRPLQSLRALRRAEIALRTAAAEHRPRLWTRRAVKKIALASASPLLNSIRRRRQAETGPPTVCYWPPFETQEELTGHYYRARWYLPRVEGKCERVRMFQSFGGADAGPGPRPECMGEFATDASHIAIEPGGRGRWREALLARVLVVWKGYRSAPVVRIARALGIPAVNVATEDMESKEYGEYCGLIWRHLLSPEERALTIQEHRRRFERLADRLRGQGFRRSCVFGTGPSLERAETFDFSDSLNVVCNSIVQSERLLDRIGPRFICAGDAISHFGVSAYAERFRADLIRALGERDLIYFGTATFGYLLLLNHPELREKVILIEQSLEAPNYDLTEEFAAPMLDSTLNIHMLPLAATFADQIWLLGCDGKSALRSNEDFWAHAAGAQYHDLVRTGHLCHPTFDKHRQVSTYERYLRSTEETIEGGERRHGKVYRSLLPSNVPALASRSIPLEWIERNAEGRPISLDRIAEAFVPGRDREPGGNGRGEGRGGDSDLPTLLTIAECSLGEDGLIKVRGWALSAEPIQRILVRIGDRAAGTASHRQRRPDVFDRHPEYGDEKAGFSYLERIEGSIEQGIEATVEAIVGGRVEASARRTVEGTTESVLTKRHH
jgi:glycosyltransferase involved in cell wall biosynthesis